MTVEKRLLELGKIIRQKCERHKVPCLAVGVYYRGQRYFFLYGFRDLERRLPVTPRTNFCIASITKSFTALTALKLQERGLLSISDTVTKYFPELDRLRDVTIEQLLSHTSGIPALCYAEASIDAALVGDTDVFSNPDAVMSLLADAVRVAEPGQKFYYLNEGYVLVGKIIEKVYGKPYRQCVEELILNPLEMQKSYFIGPKFYSDEDRAEPYMKSGRKFVKKPIPAGIEADGGLVSNLVDMLNYVEMLIRRGVFKDREVLRKESVLEAEKPRVKLPYEVTGEDYYCLGLILSKLEEYKLIHHSGSVLVHTSFMGYVPDAEVGVVVLESSSQYPPVLVGVRVLAHLLGLDTSSIRMLVFDDVLDRLCGVYSTLSRIYSVEIRRQGGFLVMRDKSGRRTVLVPEEIKQDFVKAYTLTMDGRKLEALFELRDGEIILHFERYVFTKRDETSSP